MRILVKPASGKTPRSPIAPHDRIPADGIVQIDSSAWRRMERVGDVVITPAGEVDEAPARSKK